MNYGTWSWWNWSTDWLIGAAAALLWEFIGKWLVCALGKWVCWLVLLFFELWVPVILSLLELFPTMPALVVGPIALCWKVFNYYFPLNEFLAVAGLCIVIIIAFRAFRFVKQFVPTVGN